MSRRRTSWINIRNFIGTTSLRTSRPLSVTSMLPRVGVGGSRASTATYFVPSVSYAIRGHSRKTCDQEIRHRGTCPRMNAARRPAISSAAVCMSMRDAPHPLALLRARRERPCCRRTAECDQQFTPSDGDCHTPLPREVRGNDTTPRACSLHVHGGQDSGCFTSVVLHLPLISNERNAPTAIGYSG